MRALRLLAVLVLALPLLTACPGSGGSNTDSNTEVDGVKPISPSDTNPASDTNPSARSARVLRDTDGKSALITDADAPIKPPRTTVTPDTDPDPDPNEFIQVEFEAVPQNEARIRALIQYPPKLKAKGIAGTVYVKVLIDKDGYYKSHLVRDSPDPALADAVVAALKDFYCTPARKDGKPIKVWVNFEHTFK